jgi:hypothetical protein
VYLLSATFEELLQELFSVLHGGCVVRAEEAQNGGHYGRVGEVCHLPKSLRMPVWVYASLCLSASLPLFASLPLPLCLPCLALPRTTRTSRLKAVLRQRSDSNSWNSHTLNIHHKKNFLFCGSSCRQLLSGLRLFGLSKAVTLLKPLHC